MIDDLLTEDELAERLGVSPAKVAEWRRTYGWPHVRIGRRIRYTIADVRDIESRHHVAAANRGGGLAGQSALSAARSR